ncbi:AP-1 complex subunit mu, partial [Strigomonas culicis]
MASSYMILDSKGSPLIHRTYRGDISQDIYTNFQRHVIDEEEINVKPVFEVQGVTYTFVKAYDLYFLMVSNINTCSLLQIAFIRRTLSVFESYFKVINEETVRDNFVIIYELLDEMCDFGYPQYTEDKVLKEYITQEGLYSKYILGNDTLSKKALPAAVTGAGGATPWRPPGKYHYSKNEVFLDVIEQIDILVSADGETLSSEIIGTVRVTSKLSGMPLVRVGLNDKLLFDRQGRVGRAVDMEDVKFHQCVKINQFESDRMISFVPPDGVFDLMQYRLNKKLH